MVHPERVGHPVVVSKRQARVRPSKGELEWITARSDHVKPDPDPFQAYIIVPERVGQRRREPRIREVPPVRSYPPVPVKLSIHHGVEVVFHLGPRIKSQFRSSWCDPDWFRGRICTLGRGPSWKRIAAFHAEFGQLRLSRKAGARHFGGQSQTPALEALTGFSGAHPRFSFAGAENKDYIFLGFNHWLI